MLKTKSFTFILEKATLDLRLPLLTAGYRHKAKNSPISTMANKKTA